MALWQTERAAQSHNHNHHHYNHECLFRALSPMSQSIPDCMTIGVTPLKFGATGGVNCDVYNVLSKFQTTVQSKVFSVHNNHNQISTRHIVVSSETLIQQIIATVMCEVTKFLSIKTKPKQNHFHAYFGFWTYTFIRQKTLFLDFWYLYAQFRRTIYFTRICYKNIKILSMLGYQCLKVLSVKK